MAKCFVAKIDKVEEIPKADKIHVASVLGERVIVSKEWEEGFVGLFFPPDTQLSDEFCHYNNLYRDSKLNVDKSKTGFFDSNRRVRCQPFLKVKSEGFFCELNAVDYLSAGGDTQLNIGDQFDELNSEKICEKYYSPKTRNAINNAQKKKTKSVETPLFHKHVDTDQFKYHSDKIPVGALLSFHAKVHGTSHRSSYSKVVREPNTTLDKIKDFFGMFQRESWEYLTGTRNVVLYEDQYDKEGHHGPEQFRFDVTESLKPYLEKGMTIYGEIAGYANGSPIMGRHSPAALKDKAYDKKYGKEIVYKYGCVEDTFRFHVYRITYTNEAGKELDFTDKQVMDWCATRDVLGPLEVHPPFIYDGNKEKLEELVESLTERPEVLTEDYIDQSHVSEGIIIRADSGTQVPKFYKSKSYAFKVMEGIAKENFDYEDAS